MSKRVIGFNAYNGDEQPQERETKVDEFEEAISQYLLWRKPYDSNAKDASVDIKSTVEIQQELGETVSATTSDINQYMLKRGYHMVKIEGVGMRWLLQDDAPF